MSKVTAEACHSDESQRELEELELQTRMERIGRKILVLSGKGGVGKSTVAANLAVSLATAGKKVGLLDVDLHGPSIPKILGLEGQRLGSDPTGGISPIQVSENLSVVSVGLLLDSASDAVIWRGPMKYSVIRQFLKDVAWGRLDYLVIDSPPGTGDEPLAVAQLVGRGAWALVVTTPQDVAIADVRRSVSFCQTLNLRVAGIVENMSGMVCPHCGQTVDLFKTGGGERLAAEMGVPFLGRIPLDPQIVTSGDSGTPFVQSSADSPTAKAFARVMEPILNPTREDESSYPIRQRKETPKMKIAIPIADGRLCMHFGHCEQFALVEVDEGAKAVRGTTYLTPPPHEPGVLPRWLHEQGANVIIAGGMGQRAQGLFSENGIQVIVGAPAETLEDVISAYLAGTLKVGQNVCDH
jgi:Mrp family chromosome partitioning ATPase/predicted Fe-Mo cluster-binding NifX family protein